MAEAYRKNLLKTLHSKLLDSDGEMKRKLG
jgi:hypothetical protein